ncbi:MAG: hypothetical protein DUD27_05430 [Lachnospiraceae bacterium]|nr:MAG: hypothetical protein DUD27_05430 [Lachnospiraceae bacterium]
MYKFHPERDYTENVAKQISVQKKAALRIRRLLTKKQFCGYGRLLTKKQRRRMERARDLRIFRRERAC